MLMTCNIWDPLQTEGQKTWMEKAPKWVTFSIIIILIGLFLATVIPDKQTCYAMMVANVATPNNLTAVKDSGQDIVDYIIEASERLSKEEKDK